MQSIFSFLKKNKHKTEMTNRSKTMLIGLKYLEYRPVEWAAVID